MRKNGLERVAHGLYRSGDAWDDGMYVLQFRYPASVFSHETALYLLGLAEREPIVFSVTLKAGANATGLRKDGVKVYRVQERLLGEGVVDAVSPSGHPLKTYNAERTICDLFRSRSGIDVQDLQAAVKGYIRRQKKNIPPLRQGIQGREIREAVFGGVTMIHTPRQLKALVRNLSKGNSAKAQMIIRTYVMERFLERLSRSRYRNNLILKGGTLVAAMVGLDNRSTMDVDTTVKGVDLSAESIRKIVDEIASIEIEDGMAFEIKSIEPIMDESDYPGIRVMMDAMLETMQTPLKLDFSTGDAITPSEIAYSFKLMFEDRTISILAYNLETILAEKLETLLSRGTANTRMRDFYDIFALEDSQMHAISEETLRSAFDATLKKRGSTAVAADANLILSEVETDAGLMMLWSRYQRKFDYAADIRWEMVMGAIKRLTAIAIRQN